MKTYLVTGGAGFIGSDFIRYLFEKYKNVRVVNLDKLTYAGNLENLSGIDKNTNYVFIKGDICNNETVDKIFSNYDVDYVVNFAAESHVDRSIKDPGIFVKTNVLGTQTLLESAKKHWNSKEGKKFLQVSTDEVYGTLGKEGYFTEQTPIDPHSPYSASKAAADMIVKSYFDTFGFPINITRCSNNYGPCQFPEKLIPLMINNAKNHKDLPVYGDGKQVRDWLYVRDHSVAIDLVLRKANAGQIYNIGGNNEKENISIVKTIIKIMSDMMQDNEISDILIKHITDRAGHDRRYAIEADKIKKDLGWKPEIAFDFGIHKTIQWYINNSSWLNNVTSGEYKKYYKDMYRGEEA